MKKGLMMKMADITANARPLVANMQNDHFRSVYADLSEVYDVVKPACEAHNLLLTHGFSAHGPYGAVWTRIIDLDDEDSFVESECPIPVGCNDAHKVMGFSTYCRRYQTAMLFALIIDTDDDGNSAMGGRDGQGNVSRKGNQPPARSAPPAPRVPKVERAANPIGQPDGTTCRPSRLKVMLEVLASEGITAQDLEKWAGFATSEWSEDMVSKASEIWKATGTKKEFLA